MGGRRKCGKGREGACVEYGKPRESAKEDKERDHHAWKESILMIERKKSHGSREKSTFRLRAGGRHACLIFSDTFSPAAFFGREGTSR
jgi:hypothetical protein